MRILPLTLAAAMAAFAIPASADGPKPGKWEYTTQVGGEGAAAMPGMSAAQAAEMAEAMKKMPKGMKLPGNVSIGNAPMGGMTISSTQCLTEKDFVPKGKDGKDCVITDQKKSGNTVTWAMECRRKDGDLTGTGRAVFSGDTMTSSIQMQGQQNGAPFSMSLRNSGRWLGACDQGG